MTALTRDDLTRREEMISENCDLCQAALVVTDEIFHGSGKVGNLEEIAKEFGVTASVLKRRLGIGAKRIVWTPGREEEFKKDGESGMTVKEMAEKWGIGVSRVNQLIADFGVDMEKGRYMRALRSTERVSQLAERMSTILAAAPELSAKGVAAWITKVVKSEVTEAEITAIGKLTGLPFGDLDAFPEEETGVVMSKEEAMREVVDPEKAERLLAKGKHKEQHLTTKKLAKKVPSQTGSAQKVDDVALPETPVADDVVSVPDRSGLDWIREFFKDTPEGTLDDYQEWAGITGAPKFKDIRNEYGSWANAVVLALPGD